ncbi:MAG TPA: spermidine/putrescine ABC transporter substrate-binding protein [Gemmatimonadales bacterium]|nr:spermidine/putrescine ABC transporter substrate-binding protein [Gemmatimonadales bacterium]
MPQTRRDFLRTATSTALVTTLGPSLTACAEKLVPRPGLEPELNIYNWSDYIGYETIQGFEREFGVRVNYDTFESSEEMLGKLLAGASGYDLAVPVGYSVPVMRERGLLQPLDRARVPNLVNLAPLFRDSPFDPGSRHGITWQWGLTGIAYRKDLVDAPTSWRVFVDGDPKADGRMTMLDDSREVLGAMLRLRGRSLNSTDPTELSRARSDAIAAKGHLAAFVSAAVKGQLVTGDVWMAQLWNGDARQAQAEEPNLEFVVPEDGSTIFADYMVMLAGCPHPRAAHAFLDYVLRPEVAAGISEATGFGTPCQPALPLLRDPVPYPSDAELARLEYPVDLGEATVLWDRIWTEVKAA